MVPGMGGKNTRETELEKIRTGIVYFRNKGTGRGLGFKRKGEVMITGRFQRDPPSHRGQAEMGLSGAGWHPRGGLKGRV